MEVLGIKGVPGRFRTRSIDKPTLIHKVPRQKYWWNHLVGCLTFSRTVLPRDRIYDTISPAFPNCLWMSRQPSCTYITFHSISNCLTLSNHLFIGIQMTLLCVFNRNLVIREQSFLTMLDPSAAGIVENGAARHTHDTSFIQIPLASGIGYAVRIQAYSFVFESLVCTFGKASQMPRWMMILGPCSPQEKSWEKRRSTVRPAWMSYKPSDSTVCFPLG